MNLSKILFKSTSIVLGIRIATIITGFLLVPLTYDLLGEYNFGLWMTIFSFANWINMLDIGITNSLRNDLVMGSQGSDNLKNKIRVSTAYITMLVLVLTLSFLTFIVFRFFNLGTLLDPENNGNLNHIIILSIYLMLISLFLKVINSVFAAIQKVYWIYLINFLSNILVLGALLTGSNYIDLSQPLKSIALIYLAIPIIPYLIISFLVLKKLDLLPSFKNFDNTYRKEMMSASILFFIIQLTIVLINTSDTFLITTILSPKETASFSILNKYSGIITIGTTSFFAPLWNLYTKAYREKNYKWIKQIIRLQRKYMTIPIVVSIFLIFIGEEVFRVWIGSEFYYSSSTLIIVFIISLLHAWNHIHIYFLNGIGKLKFQAIISVISIICNVPLSIILGKNFGVNGILIATIISISIFSLLAPRRVNSILLKL